MDRLLSSQNHHKIYPPIKFGVNLNDLLIYEGEVKQKQIDFDKIASEMIKSVFKINSNFTENVRRRIILDKSKDVIDFLVNLSDFYSFYAKESKNINYGFLREGVEGLISELIYKVDEEYADYGKGLKRYVDERLIS